MELRFDLWHLAFVNLIQNRAPPNFEVLSEVRLSIEPQRADMLLLRRIGMARQDDQGLVLRTLWPRLGLVTVLEYKSPVASAFRPGDLLRLIGYGVLYDTTHLAELPTREDLTLVLVVASVTPTLLAEIARMGFTLTPLGGGYARIHGVLYTTYIVVTDEVTEAERDEYLRLFSHRPPTSGEATWWLTQWMKERRMKQPDIEELQGYEEMFQKLAETMPVETRLAGLTPEQRLAGLAPEHLILALPLEGLRALSEEYVRSLPAEVQAEIQRRIHGAS